MPDKPSIALYARVSTSDKNQDNENQLRELRQYCRKRGWKIHREYVDEASGANGARPEFKQLLEDAQRREFDLVLFWALDRFSREGVLETLQYLQRLESGGVAWKSLTEEYLDSAGVFKDAIVSIMATLAKQERVKMSERTKAGLARARAQGKRLGRPLKVFDRAKVIKMRGAGSSLGEIAKEVGISRTHVHRLTREADAQT
jgi:DNA invertase Pin-like site-specific DNA recombinase